jgi:subtilisin-like proprotein convertase family protein
MALVVVATLVAGGFYLSSASVDLSRDAKPFPGPATPTKEYWIGQLDLLQARIISLRSQLAADPANVPLQTELQATIDEFAAISAMLGGDVPSASPVETALFGAKEQHHLALRNKESEIESLRQQLQESPDDPLLLDLLDQALADFESLSAELGGDRPGAPGDGSVTFVAAPTPDGCAVTTTDFTNTVPVPISASGMPVVLSTIAVAGVDSYLWDLDVSAFITHTFSSDLDITLTSPGGTSVTLTTDNGLGNDNIYNGTLWDDQADPDGQVPYASNTGLTTDHPYVNLTVATPLATEEALGAFVGEDPNGIWTLTISDDANLDGGQLNSWSLSVSTLASAPTETTTSFANPAVFPISASGTPLVSSTIAVTGVGVTLTDLKVTTNIAHTFSSDLDVTLQSPSGKVVTLTTDNALGNDNVYNGTLWDDDADPDGVAPYASNPNLATDHPYVNLVVATPLAPEEALAAFNGEDPNGTWTLTIQDDANLDGGSLNGWSIDVTTGECAATTGPCVCTPATFNNTIPAPISASGMPVVVSTIAVSGVDTYLYNLDLTSFITHSFSSDLDITLTSPLGTHATITTDNALGNDNVYNGTLWDDDADPDGLVPYASNPGLVTDHPYVNLVVATPLVIEEALGAFIGEDPNGTWTLTISDDANLDGGQLNSWSLSVCALDTTPTETTTSFSNLVPVPISAAGMPVVASTIPVLVPGTQLGRVRATTDLAHTFSSDLDVTLSSPGGTVVTLTTDNALGNDNVYAGTLWDDKADPDGLVPYASNAGLVTDHPYVNLVTATPLVPEEALAAFNDEDPNGIWTLTIADDANLDGGQLNSWSLEVTTIVCGGATGCTPGSCNDQNPCTDDVCNTATGECEFTPVVCPSDGNVCTDEVCTPSAGGCVSVPNTGPCSDNNTCTTMDSCSGGACVGGPLLNCDDGNECTDDFCDPVRGCDSTPNTAPCEDGNACTTPDACAGGACVAGPLLNCDDGNVCTDDACDPGTGCQNPPNTAPCDDANACTSPDACAGGACVGGPPLNCDDLDDCTTDSCDPATGCVNVPVPGGDEGDHDSEDDNNDGDDEEDDDGDGDDEEDDDGDGDDEEGDHWHGGDDENDGGWGFAESNNNGGGDDEAECDDSDHGSDDSDHHDRGSNDDDTSDNESDASSDDDSDHWHGTPVQGGAQVLSSGSGPQQLSADRPSPVNDTVTGAHTRRPATRR